MKLLVWIASIGVLTYSLAFDTQTSGNQVLIVSGQTEGYLSPCGCVKPMSGGIKRRVAAVRQLSVPGKTTVIDTGRLVKGRGRQDEMKAEAVAETMKIVKVAAVGYGLEEALLGEGMASSLDRLSGGALVATGLVGAMVPVQRFKPDGPFLIGSVDPRTQQIGAAIGAVPEPVADSVHALLEEARQNKLVPVLMTRGDLPHAEALAKAHPALRLIVCTVTGSPLEAPKKVGETLIVTPGEHAKSIVRLEWDGERFVNYKAVGLGPEYADDKEAQEVYSAYLGRVNRENLIAMVPRHETPKFSGNAKCGSCHAAAVKVWKDSTHSKALATLEKEGHDKDPDCVGCHVVGLNSVGGFKTRALTPMLTDVGCESCHGPGDAHSMRPYTVKMPKVGKDACLPCHNTEHSPTFDFEAYWAKIKH